MDPLSRAFISDPGLNNRGRRLKGSLYFERNLWWPNATGVGAFGYTPYGGVGISFDRVRTADGNRDLYLSMDFGIGLDMLVDARIGNFSTPSGAPLTSGDVEGWYIEAATSVNGVGYTRTWGYDFRTGDYRSYSNQVGLGLGPSILSVSGHVSFGATVNLSNEFRKVFK
jgi:hypothetical protein